MSVSSGFFNSTNGDRRYNAEQMSAIFDGIINDGVFSSVGTAFAVNAKEGDSITVGVGRAWFNSTWLYNDAILSITLDPSELLLDRYDAVVIEIDRSDSVRAGSIKVVKGTPSTSPQTPTMASSTYVHQYPLAYIYRKAESFEITQADITNCIGTSNCPYVTGILEVQNIDNIVAQWEAEFDEWFEAVKDVLGEDAATSMADHMTDKSNPHGVTASQIGAATSDHTHESYDNHVSNKSNPHGVTASQIGAAASDHTHTTYDNHIANKSNPHGVTPSQIGAAASSHNQAAGTITAGTLAGQVLANASAVATVGNKQVRNIYAGTSDMTAGSTSLTTGDIYLVYE